MSVQFSLSRALSPLPPSVRARAPAWKTFSCWYNGADLSGQPLRDLWPSPQVGWGALSSAAPRGGLSLCVLRPFFHPTSDSGFIIFPGAVMMPLIMPGNEKPQMLLAPPPCRSLLIVNVKVDCTRKQLEGRASEVAWVRGGLA